MSLVLVEYVLKVYATDLFRKQFSSSTTSIFLFSLFAAFALTGAAFFVFVGYVNRRQTVLLQNALQTNEIVTSLFPSQIRDKMMENAENKLKESRPTGKHVGPSQHLKAIMTGSDRSVQVGSPSNNDFLKTKPIAALFPEVSVMICKWCYHVCICSLNRSFR